MAESAKKELPVSTFVRVAENQISYIRRPYVRLILDASTAREAVEIIKAFNPRIDGNIFVADAEECYGIEGVPEKYFIEKVSDSMIKAITLSIYHTAI